MLILPFIHNTIDSQKFKVNVIKFLTIGGQNLWEEKATLHIDKDILNPNDIFRKGGAIKYDKSLQLCEVDLEKTTISDFYKWEEVELGDSETFCWRTYYYFTGNDSSYCWLDPPQSEKLGKYNIKDLISAIVQKK
jgi:hypothetical protein